MEKEIKNCQNCKSEFIIEPDDFAFYAKIKVPPPTFCPDCRLQRRLAWRNERTLYKRKCDAPGHNEDIISIYHKDSPFRVYDQKYWWSDEWNPMEYGRDYDWNKPFFEQFRELIKQIPKWNLALLENKNVEYAHMVGYSKNIYIATSIISSEDILYSAQIDKSRNCVDCLNIQNSELIYENINCNKIYNSAFLVSSRECIDSFFLFNCVNCKNCFMSTNLRNKEFVFRNKALIKEDYFKEIKKINGSYQTIIELKKDFELLIGQSLRKYANITKSTDCIGDNILNSKNAKYIFYANNSENIKYGYRLTGLRDSMDISFSGGELLYEIQTPGLNGARQKFSLESVDSLDIQYSIASKSCSQIFGCTGLNHKSYCILNKQYTKEEYEKLVPKIIERMNSMPYIDKKGRVYKYGEFFPVELSPFSYNETVAQEYFSLTKKETIDKGYSWKEPEERNYQIDLKTEDLPDHIKDVDDSIIGQVIECQHQGKCQEQCTGAFKIIEPELQFYRKMNLPLPRLCPNCRHYQRLKQRNPLKLWHRKCQCAGKASENWAYQNTIEHPYHKQNHCPNEFETSYAPERDEMVYCEKCYLAEVV